MKPSLSSSLRALIGHSGFVGGTLKKQRPFNAFYRSTDIADIHGRRFDEVICCGAPAQKWIANQEPEQDRAAIDGLMAHLREVNAGRFVLISTVDVFKTPVEVNEDTEIDKDGLHPYGLNRRRLEEFVAAQFEDHLIIRLPGLVGPGLRKNILYDFLNGNNLAQIDSRGIFQFYPMVNLSADIAVATKHHLRLLHLTAEPVAVSAIAQAGFGMGFDQAVLPAPARYDLRSKHAEIFGGGNGYQYSARETMLAIRAYAQSEPKAG